MRAVPARPLLPLAAAYGSFGVLWGAWGTVFPEFVAARGLTLGQAGNLLAALSVTSIATMVFLPQHLARLPPNAAVALATTVNGVGVALVALVPDPLLVLAFVVVGIGTGLTDVHVNVAGHELEVASATAVLQRLHAFYSFAAAGGALSAALGLAGGLPFQWLLVAVAALHLVAAAVNVSPDGDRRVSDAERPALMTLAVVLRVPFLLVPALILAFAFVIEGSMDVWAVFYLRETLEATPLAGGIGLAVFHVAMGLGQLFAARVLFGLGYRVTLLVSGVGATGAAAVVLLAPSPAVASGALLAVGFAIAAAVPAAIGLVGRSGADIGAAIAAVNTIGYASFVFAPPLLGWLADHVGLRAAMSVVVLAAAGIAVAGLAVPRRGVRSRAEE